MPAKNGAAKWIRVLACAALLMIGVRVCQAGTQNSGRKLVGLAAAEFPNLTRAERDLLEFADRGNINRGEFAIAGTSTAPLDPSNDPAHADEWPQARSIRASLIRWLAVDQRASQQVDPNGVRVLGARIEGLLDLSLLKIPFALWLIRCAVLDGINLQSADLPALYLNGSRTGPINAWDLTVHDRLSLANDDAGNSWGDGRWGDFRALGFVELGGTNVGGEIDLAGGHFSYSENAPDWARPGRVAINLLSARVAKDFPICCGFESQGEVMLDGADIAGNLILSGGQFSNPRRVAISAHDAHIGGSVYMKPAPNFLHSKGLSANGLVLFDGSHVEGGLIVGDAHILGAPEEAYGFRARGLSTPLFEWLNVQLDPEAELNLEGAQLGILADDEKSWPRPGKLEVDSLTYNAFGRSADAIEVPGDAASRLRWLSLQPGYHPQPYRQLAKVLAEEGDDEGATQVRIAAEDLRYAQHGTLGRVLGSFLKYTIGYGHRPLLTVLWAWAIVLFGWIVVRTAARANLMRPTYPENIPAADAQRHYESLNPLLYSIDLFFPFVNLHQEHYWWPDSEAAAEWRIFGRTFRLGTVIRYYLWFQIGAGWLLSAIFVAGVTGLIRND